MSLCWNLFHRKLMRSLKSSQTTSAAERFPTIRSWAKLREPLVRAKIIQSWWRRHSCIFDYFNECLGFSQQGWNCVGGTLVFPSSPELRSEHKASKSAPPPPPPLLPSHSPTPPPCSWTPSPLGWCHLHPVLGSGAPLHHELHSDKSSEK